jgi:hypothetical protein
VPSSPEIVAKIDRIPAARVGELASTGVATMHEASARTGVMHGIRPVTGTVTACSATCWPRHAGPVGEAQVVFPGDAIVAATDGVVVMARARLAASRSTLDNGGRREMLAPLSGTAVDDHRRQRPGQAQRPLAAAL